MDPLSIIAGCVAVATSGRTVIEGLAKLKSLRHVPDVLFAVINEISDLSLVVQEVKSIFQQCRGTTNILHTSISTVNQILDRAQVILLELDQVINYRLLLPANGRGEIRLNRLNWVREERHVQQLQQRLRSIRLDIVAGLSALNLSSTIRLEVRVQELQLVAEDLRRSHKRAEDAALRGLPSHDRILEHLCMQLEWHTAFAHLIASIDPELPVHMEDVQHEATTLVIGNLATKIHTTIIEEAKQIYQYLIHLPRPPDALLRVITLLCIAIAWFLLP